MNDDSGDTETATHCLHPIDGLIRLCPVHRVSILGYDTYRPWGARTWYELKDYVANAENDCIFITFHKLALDWECKNTAFTYWQCSGEAYGSIYGRKLHWSQIIKIWVRWQEHLINLIRFVVSKSRVTTLRQSSLEGVLFASEDRWLINECNGNV